MLVSIPCSRSFVISLFDDGRSHWSLIESQYSFHLHFPEGEKGWAFLLVYWAFVFRLLRTVSSLHLLSSVLGRMTCEVWCYRSQHSPPCDVDLAKILSHSLTACSLCGLFPLQCRKFLNSMCSHLPISVIISWAFGVLKKRSLKTVFDVYKCQERWRHTFFNPK